MGLVTVVVCEMIALLTLLLEQRQPDPAIVPFALDVEFAVEILLRRQVRIGEGRHAADRYVLVKFGDGRIAIGLAEIRGDIPVLVRIVGQRRLRREIGRVQIRADSWRAASDR